MNIFESTIPPQWVTNRLTCDYGKDYEIELAENNELTGEVAYIQLKGTRTVKKDRLRKHIKFRLESKYVIYAVQKLKKHPLFLVLVEVSTKNAWWICIQRYFSAKNLQQLRKTVTIQIPVNNHLSNLPRFYEALLENFNWIQKNQAVSLIEKLEIDLRKLDQDSNPSVAIVKEGIRVQFKPPQMLSGLFKSDPDEQLSEKLREVQRGYKVHFSSTDFSNEFARILQPYGDNGIILQNRIESDATVDIECLDENQSATKIFPAIPGTFTGGTEEVNFTGGWKGSPVAITSGPYSRRTAGAQTITFDFKQWNGSPLAYLPYFEQTLGLIQALNSCAELKLIYSTRGYQCNIVRQPRPPKIELETINEWIDHITLAREFSQYTNHPLEFSHKYLRDYISHRDLTVALYLSNEKPLDMRGQGTRIQFETLGNKLPRSHGKHPTEWLITMQYTANIWGQDFNLGEVSIVLTKANVVTTRQPSSPHHVTIIGQEDAILRIAPPTIPRTELLKDLQIPNETERHLKHFK